MTTQIILFLLLIILILSICLIIFNSINLTNKKSGGGGGVGVYKYGGNSMELLKTRVEQLISAFRDKKQELAEAVEENSNIQRQLINFEEENKKLSKALRQSKIKPFSTKIDVEGSRQKTKNSAQLLYSPAIQESERIQELITFEEENKTLNATLQENTKTIDGLRQEIALIQKELISCKNRISSIMEEMDNDNNQKHDLIKDINIALHGENYIDEELKAVIVDNEDIFKSYGIDHDHTNKLDSLAPLGSNALNKSEYDDFTGEKIADASFNSNLQLSSPQDSPSSSPQYNNTDKMVEGLFSTDALNNI